MLGTFRSVGEQAALISAACFGSGTPLAESLLAGLRYRGSSLGLRLYKLVRRSPRDHITRPGVWPLVSTMFFGGVAVPALLLPGLSNMLAFGASLLGPLH